jgi:phosphoribosylformylglycinamidine cyclo-ligase
VSEPTAYQRSGVDTEAGDLAIELMRADVVATHRGRVPGGVGGFAGLFDAGFLTSYRHPILASATDGVGTKVAIAQALDRHDTIGQDLVAMVIDDIVVVGATPLFLTDYIACGKVVPTRIAHIVSGIARACGAANVALVGGETAEHPGLLGPDEYDVAAAGTGVVEADDMLGPDKVTPGDTVIALAASGLHSNGYSLARHIVSETGLDLTTVVPGTGRVLGDELLEPTRLYTPVALQLIQELGSTLHAMSHVTGGGIAQNLQRVIPPGLAVSVDRSTWCPPVIMNFLARQGSLQLADVEDTWNMGIGFFAIVEKTVANEAMGMCEAAGISAWPVGSVTKVSDDDSVGWVSGAKGVAGGAVRLAGDYSSSSSSSSHGPID